MKGGKKPTRRQKQALQYVNLNPANWLVCKVENERLHVQHRNTGTIKIIPA
ncbi:DUF6906 family protein [Paenibacillus daejeonensis]|uniref:DUF6906 family protein n=1 Tax=Paenibacillus daejeonensis TaxID=135193 RepID=UPI000368E3C9